MDSPPRELRGRRWTRWLRDRRLWAGALLAFSLGLGWAISQIRRHAKAIEEGLQALDARRVDVSLHSNPKGTPQLPLEGSRFHSWLRLEEAPMHLIAALVAVEDHRFAQHHGVDFVRTTRAAMDGILTRRSPRGTSTITQQVARSLFLTRERHLSRKVKEALIAAYLEYSLTKRKILEIYLNVVPLGQIGPYPIEGLRAGAIAYLGKDIVDVDVSEAALLVAMIQMPSSLNPNQRPEFAAKRRNLVLRVMNRFGSLSESEFRRIAATPLRLRPAVETLGWTGHYHQLAEKELNTLNAPKGRFSVELTLDAELQRMALDAVQRGVSRIDKVVSRRTPTPLPEVALVAIDSKTGAVLALVGGRDFLASQLNRAVARRQPGSTFKPFVFAAALEYGTRKGPVGAESLVADQPTDFSFNGKIYAPANYGGYANELVTLQEALNRSLNVPAVRLARAVGYSRVAALAARMGLGADVGATPSMALGAYETSPLALAGAYATLAKGVLVTPYFVEGIRAPGGHVVYQHRADSKRVLSAAASARVTQMLANAVNYGTGSRVRAWGMTLRAAGKTGTDDDGWFAGYTTSITCVVWVGYDDNRNLRLLGADSALPIWAEFMKQAHQLPAYRDVGYFANPPMRSGIVDIDALEDLLVATARTSGPSSGH